MATLVRETDSRSEQRGVGFHRAMDDTERDLQKRLRDLLEEDAVVIGSDGEEMFAEDVPNTDGNAICFDGTSEAAPAPGDAKAPLPPDVVGLLGKQKHPIKCAQIARDWIDAVEAAREAFGDDDEPAAEPRAGAPSLPADVPPDAVFAFHAHEAFSLRPKAYEGWRAEAPVNLGVGDTEARAVHFSDGRSSMVAFAQEAEGDQDAAYLAAAFLRGAAKNRIVYATGYGRGARLAGEAALRTGLCGRVVLFETPPGRFLSAGLFAGGCTVYTGPPTLHTVARPLSGPALGHHRRLLVPAETAEKAGPGFVAKAAYGSLSRAANVAVLGGGVLARLALLTSEVAAAVKTATKANLVVGLAASGALPNGLVPSESRARRRAFLVDAWGPSDPKRFRTVKKWPGRWDVLLDAGWDLLRAELGLFHRANQGFHTLALSSPAAVHDAHMALRTGLEEEPEEYARRRSSAPRRRRGAWD